MIGNFVLTLFAGTQEVLFCLTLELNNGFSELNSFQFNLITEQESATDKVHLLLLHSFQFESPTDSSPPSPYCPFMLFPLTRLSTFVSHLQHFNKQIFKGFKIPLKLNPIVNKPFVADSVHGIPAVQSLDCRQSLASLLTQVSARSRQSAQCGLHSSCKTRWSCASSSGMTGLAPGKR